ncbi:MAG: type II toxin-antitoxin system YafQ family toxin [Lentisphaerae bacterium]|nr:type II toxin-antitoxin system YafQ family toxin [Lentisphaerota bacterium]
MRTLSQTTQFLRDVKRMRKRGKDLGKLREVVRLLAAGSPLEPKLRDHPLLGPWQPSRDCHIEPDWILIYTADETSLRLERTGTHSDLFR